MLESSDRSITDAPEGSILQEVRERLHANPRFHHLLEVAFAHSLFAENGHANGEPLSDSLRAKPGKVTGLTRGQLLVSRALRAGRRLPYQ